MRPPDHRNKHATEAHASGPHLAPRIPPTSDTTTPRRNKDPCQAFVPLRLDLPQLPDRQPIRHVPSADTTFEDPDLMRRAIEPPALQSATCVAVIARKTPTTLVSLPRDVEAGGSFLRPAERRRYPPQDLVGPGNRRGRAPHVRGSRPPAVTRSDCRRP
ncbi:DUF2165 family protein [Streptomyces filamentosus]|uniref:DUF2165 family protein n=1 Tax=Streptomyces filamentosus TaxID=67294 RepID=UPI0033F88233